MLGLNESTQINREETTPRPTMDETEPAAAYDDAAEEEEAAEPRGKKTNYTYSKEQKLKRYYTILREFMTYHHGRDDPYPAGHEFRDSELSVIEPHHIVTWLNVKMFGTPEPDFSGSTKISGSHHTLAFYRKGIGFFMPSGAEDWDQMNKTGNPTRAREVRDLINKVREMNDAGTATPRKQPKRKRSTVAVAGGDKPKTSNGLKRRAKNPAPQIPLAPVSEEVNGVLRQLHAQKTKFSARLEQMGAAIERMKSDVETSFDVMIGQISNIGARVVAAPAPDTPAGKALPRSRNLFTVWNIQNGRLTPLSSDWCFPTQLTAIDAMNMWLIGDPPSHSPPLQYLTSGHMKHVKGAADSFSKVRRFMKVARYLGLKVGYWVEDWDSAKIDTLWEKIVPGIEAHIPMSYDAKQGNILVRHLIGTISKNGGIGKEIADNPQVLSEQHLASVIASQAAAAGGEGGTEDPPSSAPPRSRNLELLWGVHHGKLNPVPADWEFPSHVSVMDILHLWFLGEPDRKVPPLMYIHSSYVQYLKSGTGYLSKLRCVMKVVQHYGVKLNCWYEEDWDDGKITSLWYQVWDEIEDHIKFKQCDGRDGAVTWQSIYNRMYESQLLKDVNEDQGKEADQDKEVDQDKESELHEEV